MNNSLDSRRPILLVEDNPLDIDLTKRAFKKRHFLNPLSIARDGEEALACIERWEQGRSYTPPHPIGLEAAQGRRLGSPAPNKGACNISRHSGGCSYLIIRGQGYRNRL